MPIGRSISAGPMTPGAEVLSGSTPTISVGVPSIRTTRPMILASPPKRDCHRLWLMMTT
jgi:hypothetical protein